MRPKVARETLPLPPSHLFPGLTKSELLEMVQIIYPKKIHKQDLETRWENTSEKEMQFCHFEACVAVV